jgi:hypothetical protein
LIAIAKTCNCKEKEKKVTYSLVDTYHNLCLDKIDIISAELQACKRLLKYTGDKVEKQAVEDEISHLKMALDLLLL